MIGSATSTDAVGPAPHHFLRRPLSLLTNNLTRLFFPPFLPPAPSIPAPSIRRAVNRAQGRFPAPEGIMRAQLLDQPSKQELTHLCHRDLVPFTCLTLAEGLLFHG